MLELTQPAVSVLMTHFNCLTSGTKEAKTNSASVSDDNSTSLWRDSTEPEPAVKPRGKKAPPASPFPGGDPQPPPAPLARRPGAAAGPGVFDPCGVWPLVLRAFRTERGRWRSSYTNQSRTFLSLPGGSRRPCPRCAP